LCVDVAGYWQVSAGTHCRFGGKDGKTLYITAWSSVWKVIGMPIPGLTWQVDRERQVCPD
jgi:hypothetical protein